MRLGLVIVGANEVFWTVEDFLFDTSEIVLIRHETNDKGKRVIGECKKITVQEYNDCYFNPETTVKG